jgi:hypothetical protein
VKFCNRRRQTGKAPADKKNYSSKHNVGKFCIKRRKSHFRLKGYISHSPDFRPPYEKRGNTRGICAAEGKREDVKENKMGLTTKRKGREEKKCFRA